MLGTEVKPNLFGLTGPTSASGVSTETVETLKAHTPLQLLLLMHDLQEHVRRLPPPSLPFNPTFGVFSEHMTAAWRVSPGRDELLERIKDRRNRLLRERGPYTDSVSIIRELREAEP